MVWLAGRLASSLTRSTSAGRDRGRQGEVKAQEIDQREEVKFNHLILYYHHLGVIDYLNSLMVREDHGGGSGLDFKVVVRILE